MLLSNRHKFIFVHVPKTAGQSIAKALEPYSDNLPRKGFRRLMAHLPVPESPDAIAFGMHGTARWAKLKLPNQVFQDYRKFAVVRNPFDRAVSHYHYLSQRADHHLFERVSRLSFKGFLDYLAQKRRLKDPTQLHYICDEQGNPLVDTVLRFETLEQDFNRLCEELALPAVASLPRKNTSDHKPYWEYYEDDYNLGMARELFAADFKAFSYSTEVGLPQVVSPRCRVG